MGAANSSRETIGTKIRLAGSESSENRPLLSQTSGRVIKLTAIVAISVRAGLRRYAGHALSLRFRQLSMASVAKTDIQKPKSNRAGGLTKTIAAAAENSTVIGSLSSQSIAARLESASISAARTTEIGAPVSRT